VERKGIQSSERRPRTFEEPRQARVYLQGNVTKEGGNGNYGEEVKTVSMGLKGPKGCQIVHP